VGIRKYHRIRVRCHSARPIVYPYRTLKNGYGVCVTPARVRCHSARPVLYPCGTLPDVGPLRLRTTTDSTIISSRVPSSRIDPVPHCPIVPISATHASWVAMVPDSCPSALFGLKTTMGSLTAMLSENAISKDTYPISAMVNQRIQVQLHDHFQLRDDQHS
jgi:hypothetical protein